jgi:hypothetical protein
MIRKLTSSKLVELYMSRDLDGQRLTFDKRHGLLPTRFHTEELRAD